MTRVLTAALCCAAALAPTSVTGAQGNVALHKSYRLSPGPSYRHCTDSGDRTQLTDGVYTKGYFWTQKTTVGWAVASSRSRSSRAGRTSSVTRSRSTAAPTRCLAVRPAARRSRAFRSFFGACR